MDEVDQLLHGADVLVGQEELLVGCIEDDDGGHRDLAGEKEGEGRKKELFLGGGWANIFKVHH